MNYEHYCHEWDGMKIDETMPEFGCCICFHDEDSDRFRDKIIDVIYNVLGRNLHINHTEIYYIGHYWINKIDGIKVNSKGNSVKWNFSPDMFIPAS